MEGDIVYYDEPNDYDAHEDAVREEFKWDLDVNSGTVSIPYLETAPRYFDLSSGNSLSFLSRWMSNLHM